MSVNKQGWGYVVLSVIGGVLIAGAFLLALQTLTVKADPVNTITTSGGMVVKMGKVLAELPQTNINVGSGANLTVPLGTEAKEVADLLAQAGIKDTDLITGNLTVCLASVVSYKTELNGIVGTKIDKQCRNFTPGMMAATINTFAEDYTKHVVSEYKTKYNFIK
jgi:adenine-specific DNA methylase